MFGIVVTVFAFAISAVFPRLSDAMLRPAYYFSVWYWGGVHDPLQLLLALFMNVVFLLLGDFLPSCFGLVGLKNEINC
jgi:hypothetical protein